MPNLRTDYTPPAPAKKNWVSSGFSNVGASQAAAKAATQAAAAKAAIAAQANAKRNVSNKAALAKGKSATTAYGGGPITGTAQQQSAYSSAPVANAQFAAASAPAAPPAPPPAPKINYAGSGRVRSTGDVAAPQVAAAFSAPESIAAPIAQVAPPVAVEQAPPSAVNVPGESFNAMGTPGTIGGFERRRQSRGPMSGVSVTPEMLRRAAATRLG